MVCWQRIRTGSANDSVALREAVRLQDPLELAPCNQMDARCLVSVEEASGDGTACRIPMNP